MTEELTGAPDLRISHPSPPRIIRGISEELPPVQDSDSSGAESSSSEEEPPESSEGGSANEEDYNEDDLPYPGFLPTVLHCQHQHSAPRKWCLQIITWPYPFVFISLYGFYL